MPRDAAVARRPIASESGGAAARTRHHASRAMRHRRRRAAATLAWLPNTVPIAPSSARSTIGSGHSLAQRGRGARNTARSAETACIPAKLTACTLGLRACRTTGVPIRAAPAHRRLRGYGPWSDSAGRSTAVSQPRLCSRWPSSASWRLGGGERSASVRMAVTGAITLTHRVDQRR
jgi:hypothetical protein